MRLRTLLFAAAALATGLGPAAAVAACAPKDSGPQAIQAVVEMFAAAKADDAEGFHRATAPDFFAYDTGRRYDGDALFAFIKAAHAKGLKAEWTVTEPKVTLDCRTALVTYVNRGALGDASGMKPVTWLESAWLRREAGAWRVAFLHSTRAAP